MLELTLDQLKTASGKLASSISGNSVASAIVVTDLFNPLRYSSKLVNKLILELDKNQLSGLHRMMAFVKAVGQHRYALGL